MKGRDMQSRIIVEPDVLTSQPNAVDEFGIGHSYWAGPVAFMVTPALDDIEAALARAAERFWLVNDEGIERPGRWVLALDRMPDVVVGPSRFHDGFIIAASEKDAITPPQANTLLRVLIAELHVSNVDARILCAPSGLDLGALDLPRGEKPGQTADEPLPTSEFRVYVVSRVRCLTTTGEAYEEREWLLTDLSWSRDGTNALSFENSQSGLAEYQALKAELQNDSPGDGDSSMRSIRAVLRHPVPDRASVTEGMPPSAIRDHGYTWQQP